MCMNSKHCIALYSLLLFHYSLTISKNSVLFQFSFYVPSLLTSLINLFLHISFFHFPFNCCFVKSWAVKLKLEGARCWNCCKDLSQRLIRRETKAGKWEHAEKLKDGQSWLSEAESKYLAGRFVWARDGNCETRQRWETILKRLVGQLWSAL